MNRSMAALLLGNSAYQRGKALDNPVNDAQALSSALRELGFTSLLSTFLAGNDSSMLWHWRVGFRLLSYPGSPRRHTPHPEKRSSAS